MRLTDLHEKETQEESNGTYAAVTFCDESVNTLTKFVEDNEIPNPVAPEKFHCTLMYSRKPVPEFEPQSVIDPQWAAEHKNFELWDSQPDDDGNTRKVLVMQLDCPELVDRFNFIMDNYDATYDFDEYKPHVTLSYDAGEDFDVSTLKWAGGDPINVASEYREELS